MSKLTKEEFRQEMHNFLQNININNTTINLDRDVDNQLIDDFFYKYYNQVPKLDVYKDSITSIVQDAVDDGQQITFKDILEKWNDSDDRTTIASNSTTDSIEDYLGGKRKTNKRKTNKRKTNKRKTNKRKTNKRKNKSVQLKGGKRMTDTITTEPIAYKEDEYDQQKNNLNY